MLDRHVEVRSHVGEGATFNLGLSVYAGNAADQ
jgi:hypothetical protein